jgi:hypothetical protein
MDTPAEHAPREGPAGEPPARRRRAAAAVAIALAALLAASALGADLVASARFRASADSREPLATRLAAAEAAEALWPFAPAYRTRVITLRGLKLLEGGDILGAYDLLHAEYVREAIAKDYDPELVKAHALAYKEYLDASSRTAHRMHGMEQPDGTIRPEDVQRFPRPAPK